jgi:hypothetical protein
MSAKGLDEIGLANTNEESQPKRYPDQNDIRGNLNKPLLPPG